MSIQLTIHGEVREFPEQITYQEIAAQYQKDYSEEIILVKFQNNLKELTGKARRDGKLEFITTKDKPGTNTYRRSVSFLMEAAALKCFPNQNIMVRCAVGQGYYCEFREGVKHIPTTPEMLETLSTKMREMAAQNLPIEKRNISTQDAIYLFHQNNRPEKEKLLRFRRSSRINIYELCDYPDYYYGYMAPSTGYLRKFELFPYRNGFILLFPNAVTGKIEPFIPRDKLTGIIEESGDWGEKMGVRTVGDLNGVIADGSIQDLILVQESWMEKRIGDIAKQIADENKRIVLIAGPSSSGKTTFSHRLSIQLRAQGLKPHPISMDDFYLNREDTPRDESGEYDFECLEALDIPMFNQCMNDLLEGKEVLLPVYNFKTGKREFRNQTMTLEPEGVLVIEGIHGLNEKLSCDLPRESKFKIYISALTQLNIDAHNHLPTTDGRLIRRMVRDYRTRNTSARETLARWDSVRRGEEKNIFPYQEEADVMFNSALIYELSVLKLYAEPMLFSIPEDCPEYIEAKRLLKFLEYFLPVPGENIGHNSILREFMGGSCFNV